MKIFLSYPSENDQGEGIHYQRVLRRLGHDVMALNVAGKGPGPGGRLNCGYPAYVKLDELIKRLGRPDLFLYVEPDGLMPRGLEQAAMTTAGIIGDVHRNLRFRLKLAKFFDHVFLYQRNYIDHFVGHDADRVHWLPYACDTEF